MSAQPTRERVNPEKIQTTPLRRPDWIKVRVEALAERWREHFQLAGEGEGKHVSGALRWSFRFIRMCARRCIGRRSLRFHRSEKARNERRIEVARASPRRKA